MIRVGVGVVSGLAAAALILAAARWALHALEPGKVYALEHGVVYTSLVLGAGFGAVCGAISGRDRPPS